MLTSPGGRVQVRAEQYTAVQYVKTVSKMFLIYSWLLRAAASDYDSKKKERKRDKVAAAWVAD